MKVSLWEREDSVTLVEKHSSGRSADLWRGILDGAEVAVKIYRPTFDDGGLFDESVDRESRVECRDSRIVAAQERGVIKFSRGRWSHVLVMPMIDAECLGDVIRRSDLDSNSRVAVSNEIVNSLASLHECGLTHGDLNPSNILVSEEECKAYLIDLEFCLPIEMGKRGSDYSRERGTPGYIAPEIEVYGIRASSCSSDVWALGWVLAETLNQDRVPRDRDWRRHREKCGSRASMLDDWGSEIGGEIDESVRKCVVIDRRDRIKMGDIAEIFGNHVD